MQTSRTVMWLLLLGLLLFARTVNAASEDECEEDEPQNKPSDQQPEKQPDNPQSNPSQGKPATPDNPDDGDCDPEDAPEKKDDPAQPDKTDPQQQPDKGDPEETDPQQQPDKSNPDKSNPDSSQNCKDLHAGCSANKSVCKNDTYAILMLMQCTKTCDKCKDYEHIPNGTSSCKNKSPKCFRESKKKLCSSDPQTKEECPYTCGTC